MDRLRRTLIGTTTALAVTLGAAACSSQTAGEPTTGAMPPTAFRQALAMLDPAALGEEGFLALSDSARIRALQELENGSLWRGLDLAGASALTVLPPDDLLTDTGIDVGAAAFAIEAGQPPALVTVISGGQDAQRITTAITAAGWQDDGSGTYSREQDLGLGGILARLSISAPKIRPDAADLVFSGATGDPGAAGPGATGIGTRPAVAAAAGCLEDVVLMSGVGLGDTAATGWADDVRGVAVGVRAGGPEEQSVLCLLVPESGDPQAVATRTEAALQDRSLASGQPWDELLPDAVVDVLPTADNAAVALSVVRITSTTTGLPPNRVLSMLYQRDIPGAGSE
ncbi:hypothetical protein GIS00_12775 [Nakamurella sp. YIM 132087]|uniref:Uncharacterized protein n=1 Tax=Nakamurella alba TaxID=2665158 RepID=A0A7K1FKZ8_9ACTN|nr:hypothetical protein [Nakamurella alba]MTD14815.1 hypothetical protein [Nakamurella alba]